MDVAYVSALSALAGSIVGGLTSGLTSWLNQRSQARAEQFHRDRERRKELYKDFILEASKAYSGAVMSNQPDIKVYRMEQTGTPSRSNPAPEHAVKRHRMTLQTGT